jgi:hypothetical protein
MPPPPGGSNLGSSGAAEEASTFGWAVAGAEPMPVPTLPGRRGKMQPNVTTRGKFAFPGHRD